MFDKAQQVYFTSTHFSWLSSSKATSKKLLFITSLVCYLLPVVKLPTIRMAGIFNVMLRLRRCSITTASGLVYMSLCSLILGPSLRLANVHRQSAIMSSLVITLVFKIWVIIGTTDLTSSYLGGGLPLAKLLRVQAMVTISLSVLLAERKLMILCTAPNDMS